MNKKHTAYKKKKHRPINCIHLNIEYILKSISMVVLSQKTKLISMLKILNRKMCFPFYTKIIFILQLISLYFN